MRHHFRGLDEPEPLLNPIGIYQASKILVLPMTAVLKLVVYGNAQSNYVWAALVIVMVWRSCSHLLLCLRSRKRQSSHGRGWLWPPQLSLSLQEQFSSLAARKRTPLYLLDQQQLYVIGYMLSVTFTFEGTQPFTPERLSFPVLVLIAATACMAAILCVWFLRHSRHLPIHIAPRENCHPHPWGVVL